MPLAEGAEFSVEIDPNEIDEPALTALAEAGHEPRLHRGAGFRRRHPAGHRPHPGLRGHARHGRGAPGAWNPIAERGHPLWAAASEPGADRRKRPDAPVAVSGPRGALRLCACPVDGQAAGDDPDRRAAHAGGTPAPVQHGAAPVPLGRLRRDRHRPFRPSHRQHGRRRPHRASAPEFPGLYRRHLRCADRPRRLGDLEVPAGLRPERQRHRAIPGLGPRGTRWPPAAVMSSRARTCGAAG
jgi:hypothetical protein